MEEFSMASGTLLCVGAIVAVRLYTLNLTEGQAFIAGWPFWLAAVVFGGSVVLMLRAK